jgi:hypothetical protein
MQSSDLYTFAMGEHIFTSMDFKTLPSIPAARPGLKAEDWEPWLTTTLQWATPFFPQIAFVPCYPDFNNTLFTCLKCELSIGSINGRWQLEPKTRDAWITLEESLQMAVNILIAGQLLPLNFCWFPLPQRFGYTRTHKSRKIAAKCADTSRQAFVQLGAMCSFAVAINLNGELRSFDPPWVRMLRAGGVHAVWIDHFRSSQLADFVNTERVGSIVHPKCEWFYFSNIMRLAGVPLLFFWERGNRNSFAQAVLGHKVKGFIPTEEQIFAARNPPVPEEPSIDSYSIQGDQNVQAAAPSPKAPPPERYSGQKQGQTWQEFFERQRVLQEELIKVESPAKRRSRISREQEAMRTHYPPSSGVVWQWVDVDGFLIRQRVSRKMVADEWTEYAPTQRRFNGFTNAWDLCHAFDPEAKLNPVEEIDIDDEYGDDDERDYMYPSMPVAIVNTNLPPPPTVAVQNCSSSAVRNIYEHDDSVEDEQRFSFWEEPIDSLLFFRYGFHPTSDDAERYIRETNRSQTARKTLGVSENNWSSLTAKPEMVVHFVDDLKSRTDPSESWWDLNNNNEAALAQQLDHDVLIYTCHTGGGTCYIVDPRDLREGDASWQIVVKSAATALECLRHRWGSSRYSVARELLARGIQFSTVRPMPPIVINTTPRLPYRHSPRQVGYVPDRHDYRQYEECLRKYFLDEPHARAALLRGGLLWRLAKEVLGNTLDEYVLLGPSEEAQSFGTYVELSPQEREGWDDDLSEDELDFICGVVPILTGMFD